MLHGSIMSSTWADPLAPIGGKSEFGEAWFIKLTPAGDVPCNDIIIDPIASTDGPFQLPSGDIQIPYGIGCFHMTQHNDLSKEMAFSA